ncbi:MAG: SUF system NifU family Fe-S cluster assembly protein [Acidobacteriota bacterium]
MTHDVTDLYRNSIVDHYKNPRNYREMEGSNRKGEGNNTLCGDRFNVFIRLEDNRIADISFTGSGCAVATASASMMTENLKGKTLDGALSVYSEFMELLYGETNPEKYRLLGELSVFSGVRGYPARIKCAAFAWKIFHGALEGNPQPLYTE